MRLKGGDPLVSVYFGWLKCNCEYGLVIQVIFRVVILKVLSLYFVGVWKGWGGDGFLATTGYSSKNRPW